MRMKIAGDEGMALLDDIAKLWRVNRRILIKSAIDQNTDDSDVRYRVIADDLMGGTSAPWITTDRKAVVALLETG
ncbi:hypothetical protein ACFRJ9_19595 [Paenarthrobacter sp. NPDC056912]|uniref:hypothetical protein n=1 Tax=Paenarthrobacter sp. NPDC056912 TaxID=3345965 RepID=UPI00366EEC5F